MIKKKIVLVYSGGLDIFYCIKYFIKELDYELYVFMVDIGGFLDSEFQEMEE